MALARRYAAAGYRVALLARRQEVLDTFAKEIEGAEGFACDVTDLDAIASSFAAIRARLGPIHSLIYNAGSGTWGNVDQVSAADLDRAFAINARGLFACAQAALPDMRAAKEGVIAVVGATASLRGKPGTLTFAAGKAAQRSIAQSLARQLGSEGIHVFLAIIDGMVGKPERMSERPDEDFMRPEHIAEAMWQIANQPRSAWTFELDLRPHKETW